MTDAFAAALRVLLNDANMGEVSSYTAPGGGPGQSLRVIVSDPDEMMNVVSPGAVAPQAVVTCATSDLPGAEVGGVFVVRGEEYEVLATMQEDRGLVWRLPCRRLAYGSTARDKLRQASA
jgi:hypothetical protein